MFGECWDDVAAPSKASCGFAPSQGMGGGVRDHAGKGEGEGVFTLRITTGTHTHGKQQAHTDRAAPTNKISAPNSSGMQEGGKIVVAVSVTFMSGVVVGWLLNTYTRKVRRASPSDYCRATAGCGSLRNPSSVHWCCCCVYMCRAWKSSCPTCRAR